MADNARAARMLQALNLTRFPVVAIYSIVVFDFLLLIDQEHRLIYKSRWTWLKAIYLVCRYYPLTVWPFTIWLYVVDHSYETCIPMVTLQQLSFIPLHFFPHCMLIIRVWAFSGRKRWTLALLLACLSGYLAVQIWSTTGNHLVSEIIFATFGRSGCFRRSPHSKNQFAYCLNTRSTHGRLGKLFLIQAFSFFCFMLCLNLGSAYLFSRDSSQKPDGTAWVSTLILPNILACRFILQLREQAIPSASFQLQIFSKQIRGVLTCESRDCGVGTAEQSHTHCLEP
ncbi:hypothetical protein B0H34DRAFT_113281 [Crassisporium funariophilum]|nr:hypothetical protein B0H34DRAFT_113281 [Crassisporium funariophilum]